MSNKNDLRKTELAIILHNACTVEQLEVIKEIFEMGIDFQKIINQNNTNEDNQT